MEALDYITTPCGTLAITANEQGVTSVKFIELFTQQPRLNSHTSKAKKQLMEYFEGTRKQFSLPLAPQGTPFQMTVWQALKSIEFGTVASYLDVAKMIGNANACRAVGAANGRNPISILVPCHRIIGSTGKLTGYAGGLARKQWLLDHENSQ